jgi:hypothetical protein
VLNFGLDGGWPKGFAVVKEHFAEILRTHIRKEVPFRMFFGIPFEIKRSGLIIDFNAETGRMCRHDNNIVVRILTQPYSLIQRLTVVDPIPSVVAIAL